MSKVTAEIHPAPQPAPEPRIVRAPWGTEYRARNGTIEARVSEDKGWHESGIFSLPANALAADEAAILADLKANPTVQPPAGEDTVVLRMPRSTADTVMRLAGNVVGGGPIREHTDAVFIELDDALDPTGTNSWKSLFTDVFTIKQELQ